MLTSSISRSCFYLTRTLLRNASSSTCGWEDVLKKARCIKEPLQLDYNEELGICIPQVETPIKKPEGVEDLSIISGVPCDAFLNNTALIHKRTKSSMQSGTANTHVYILHYARGMTWENPLMGWASSANSLNAVEISFPDFESAKLFAMKNGWKYHVLPEHKEKKMPRKNYGLNFSWNKRTRSSTK